MEQPVLAFIGGGNMARSLVGGLVADGHPAARIRVADPSAEKRAALAADYGVAVHADNTEAAADAAVVVLAVKPQVLRAVAEGLAPVVQARRPLVISIAAGVREPDIRRWLGGEVPVVRTMPNTPALVQSGATALYANPLVSAAQREVAESVLRAVGVTLWVEEEALLDAVTALSGSGPAYFFLLMECLEAAGVRLGLTPEQARLLTLETAYGAAKMALASGEDPAVLRARVTSPGGTTEAALRVFAEAGLGEIVARAVTAARDRAEELGRILGGEGR
ncbi:pyrroline-5-carboxylate reductase [Inmirania thermothiophila]|uniref:Pyrroline-5-carboxylate reductase n=1 Tax=Inmirania thermothiophila TaxID=1750597 RepID=A0A3N1Y6N6_9GAMM|nr:pyrroline-5-carboxylate reductase [Inmirania thermothiophila]ROR34489.1 pyrroline-5-carboxylate reductase [Inmirania thermothiophila]